MGGLASGTEPASVGRFASLDGFRAVAALGVVVFHVAGYADLTAGAGPLNRFLNNLGNFGVATFFVLSGFLLYRPFVSAWFDQRPAPDPMLFLRHRLIRIFPAYWLALSTFIALGLLKNKTPTGDFYFTLYALIQDYRNGYGFAGISVAWTLSIEVSFYLALPLIAGAIRVIGRRARNERMRLEAQLVGLGMLAAVGLIYRILVAGPFQFDNKAHPGSVVHLWLPNYFDWFALGMLGAVLVVWRDRGHGLPRALQDLLDRGWVPWLFAAACYVTLMMLRDTTGGDAGGAGRETTAAMCLRFALNGLAAAFFLAPGVLGRSDQRILRALASPVPAFLGLISYGIYLWHKIWLEWLARNPAAPPADWSFWVMLAAVLAGTVVTASASFYLLERPIGRFKDPRRLRPPARGLVTTS